MPLLNLVASAFLGYLATTCIVDIATHSTFLLNFYTSLLKLVKDNYKIVDTGMFYQFIKTGMAH